MIIPVPSSPDPFPSSAVIDTMAGDTLLTIWLIEADPDVLAATRMGGAAAAVADVASWRARPDRPAPATPPTTTARATTATTPRRAPAGRRCGSDGWGHGPGRPAIGSMGGQRPDGGCPLPAGGAGIPRGGVDEPWGGVSPKRQSGSAAVAIIGVDATGTVPGAKVGSVSGCSAEPVVPGTSEGLCVMAPS